MRSVFDFVLEAANDAIDQLSHFVNPICPIECNDREANPLRQENLRFEFSQGASRDMHESNEVLGRSSAGAFRDIADDRYRRPPHLRRQPKHFAAWKGRCGLKHIRCKRHTLLPDDQIAMIAHIRSLIYPLMGASHSHYHRVSFRRGNLTMASSRNSSLSAVRCPLVTRIRQC